MNMYKIFFTALLICVGTYAQNDYSKSLDGIEWVRIESRANITVKTHGDNNLLIKGGSKYKTPERAKGLKLVGEEGSDNTDVGFYVIKQGNVLIVRNLRKNKSAEIYLPSSQNIAVVTNWQGNIKIEGFKGEIEATAHLNGSIKIENVNGPLTANTLNGSIEVNFSKVSQVSPITIFSTNGALDISLPEKTPANVSLGTINGEIYTNFDLKVPNKEGLKAIATKKVRGEITGGGVNIKLNTANGNIYLRKK